MVIQKILCIVIGYCFGLFQTGFIIGKCHNIDIRDHGSGNSGTTNTMRTLGKKFGILTFFGDALKAVFAMILTYFLFRNSCEGHIFVVALYTGLGAILGHNFPFYMNFKGGKGIATTGGMIFAMAVFDWKFLVCALVIFFSVLLISKYVSLGSMALTVGFLIEIIIWGQLEMVNGLNPKDRFEVYILVALITILSIVRHKENIVRLLNGTERKIGQKKES